MKFWTSSETSGGTGTSPNKMLLKIEDTFNNTLINNDYGKQIIEINYIAIILSPKFDIYEEVSKYKKSKGEFEFRLKIHVDEYKNASEQEKIKILFTSVLKAIDKTFEFNIKGFDCEKLKSDCMKIGKANFWI